MEESPGRFRTGEPPTSDDIAQLHDARYAFLGFYNERPWDKDHIETAIGR